MRDDRQYTYGKCTEHLSRHINGHARCIRCAYTRALPVPTHPGTPPVYKALCLLIVRHMYRACLSPAAGRLSARSWGMSYPDCWASFSPRVCLVPARWLGIPACRGPIMGHVSVRLLGVFQPGDTACLSPTVGHLSARECAMSQPDCGACCSPVVGHVSARRLGVVSCPTSGLNNCPTFGGDMPHYRAATCPIIGLRHDP